MTVFMSPRTAYVLGRHDAHTTMSFILAFGILLSGVSMLARPFAPTSLTLWGLTGLALSKPQGRRAIKRTAKESFYGTVGGIFGIASSDYNDEIGGGGSSVESD